MKSVLDRLFFKRKNIVSEPGNAPDFEPKIAFLSSREYWETRYARGGRSGKGSYGNLAKYKADVINNFVKYNDIQSVMEFGCGDGNQLSLAVYPRYFGYDVSNTVIAKCRGIFSNDTSKAFDLMENYKGEKTELSLSLDVIYHLVEDEVYAEYMNRLFDSSIKYVIVYSSNHNSLDPKNPHIRHRKFSEWVSIKRPDFVLMKRIKNELSEMARRSGDKTDFSPSDFYVYQKT